MKRVFHALDDLAFGFWDRLAAVIDAKGRDGPAVIAGAFDDVDLIAAARTVFIGPQRAGPWVERGALLIAVAVTPDLRAHVLLAHKRVVLGHSAVGIKAHDFALKLVEVL